MEQENREKILKIINLINNFDDCSTKDIKITDCSLSSLEFVELILALEEQHSVEFEVEDLDMRKYDELSDFVDKIKELKKRGM